MTTLPRWIYRGMVLAVFQAYRAIVLPVANTWMSWSLLNKMDLVSPGYPLTALLGVALVACLVAGMQVRRMAAVGGGPRVE